MSVKDNPNKSQNEELRDEIPDGIGYGKQGESNFDTINRFAKNLNKESESKSEQKN